MSQLDLLEKKQTDMQDAAAEVEQAPLPYETGDNKSPAAFKTISEAAQLLGVPQHVLRFWESRFTQVRPLRLKGGRRYYRPEDIEILTAIKNMLYKQGFTIKGARKAFGVQRKLPLEEAAEGQPQPAQQSPQERTARAATKATQMMMPPEKKRQLQQVRRELIEIRDALRRALV